MFWNFMAVALGGAIGSCLRYAVSLGYSGTQSMYPLHTLSVNIIGSFAIGLLYAYISSYSVPTAMKMFLFVGLLGGFTTFSSFALDSINIARNSGYPTAALYIAINNIGGIMAALAGIVITHYLTQAK